MAGMTRTAYVGLLLLLFFISFPSLVHGFGAGNIQSVAKIEGINWRHGDIEDTFLNLFMARVAGGKKFSKIDVKRIYFGNWLRDYSQAVDVGTVKYVSAEAIRIILWVLGFMSFGYGTNEFEVTQERLGVYRPEEHIDNPKDYAENLDARKYDPRLRGPIDEERELSIDPRNGLKSYIASEDKGITTSAGLIRDLFGRCIYLGRQYGRTKAQADLHEALRLLGTGCHCLEDFSAHSNYCEIALRQMGNEVVFPHVGARTRMHINGIDYPVFPIVTGTFGGVDFLHSVLGEFSDKVSQSEITELEGTISNSENSGNTDFIKNLLHQLPSGILGSDDIGAKVDELETQSATTKMENMDISARDPETLTVQIDAASKKIYPVLQFHDNVMQTIDKAISRIPILPALLEQLKDQINIFVFSLLAPVVLPLLKQVKSQLETGSSAVIASSREKQYIVFNDDRCTDPTHSMLSKDHFSNVLNEPAGQVASTILTWVVPQLMACWDDESIDINRTMNRIIHGVFHHPALRDYGDDGARDCRQNMFKTMEKWWQAKSEDERRVLREQLSRDGVKNGRNHKDGIHDSGHGCGPPATQTAGNPTKPPASAQSSTSNMPGSYPQQGYYGVSSGHLGTVAALGGATGIVGALASNFAGGSEKPSESYHYDSSHGPKPNLNTSGRPNPAHDPQLNPGPPPGQQPGYVSNEQHLGGPFGQSQPYDYAASHPAPYSSNSSTVPPSTPYNYAPPPGPPPSHSQSSYGSNIYAQQPMYEHQVAYGSNPPYASSPPHQSGPGRYDNPPPIQEHLSYSQALPPSSGFESYGSQCPSQEQMPYGQSSHMGSGSYGHSPQGGPVPHSRHSPSSSQSQGAGLSRPGNSTYSQPYSGQDTSYGYAPPPSRPNYRAGGNVPNSQGERTGGNDEYRDYTDMGRRHSRQASHETASEYRRVESGLERTNSGSSSGSERRHGNRSRRPHHEHYQRHHESPSRGSRARNDGGYGDRDEESNDEDGRYGSRRTSPRRQYEHDLQDDEYGDRRNDRRGEREESREDGYGYVHRRY